MIYTEDISEQEILNYIKWLEDEIDKCLEYDLPIHQLEIKLEEALNHYYSTDQ